MANKVHWDQLTVSDSENVEIVGDARIRKLREFRATNSMWGAYFPYGGEPHEDRDDSSTWGPQSPDSVDWTEFPQA